MHMKLKGIWIAIGLILIIGCLSTNYFQSASNFHTEQLQNTERTASSAGMSASARMAPEPPKDDVSDQAEEEEPESVREESQALLRLKELDKQIEKNHAGDADTTANARKAAADNELRLWESELSRILEALEAVLDEEQKTELMKAQKQWLIDRESVAEYASKKQIGSTLEELEYTIALAEASRERAYELADVYAPYLDKAE